MADFIKKINVIITKTTYSNSATNTTNKTVTVTMLNIDLVM